MPDDEPSDAWKRGCKDYYMEAELFHNAYSKKCSLTEFNDWREGWQFAQASCGLGAIKVRDVHKDGMMACG